MAAGNKGRRELVGGGSVAFAYRLMGLAFSYGLIKLIAKQYGAVGNGMFNIYTAWMAVFGALVTLGLNSSNVRSVAEYRAKGEWGKLRPLHDGVFRVTTLTSVLVGACLVGVCAITLWHGGQWMGLDRDTLLLIALSLPFNALLLVNVEFIRGAKKIAISELLRSPAVLILTFIGVFLFPRGPGTPVLVFALSTAGCGLFAWTIVRRYLRKMEVEHQAVLTPVRMGEHLMLALPMIVTSLVTTLNGRLDTIMLSWYQGNDVVGIYGTAVKISIGLEFVISAIKTIAMPKIAELFHGGRRAELEDTLAYSAKLIFWTTAPLMLVLVIFAKTIMGFVGPEFVAGAGVLRIMAVAHFISASSGMVGAFLNMTGGQAAFSKIVLVAVGLNFVLNLMLLPAWGMWGAAWASSISLGVWNVAAAVHIKRKFKYNMFYWPFGGKTHAPHAG
jgi:O-antigen/teichoic acid export membrane protein